MPKYIFSEGTVTVEDGIYNPLLDREKRGGDATLLLILRNNHPVKTKPEPNTLKEQQNDHQTNE